MWILLEEREYRFVMVRGIRWESPTEHSHAAVRYETAVGYTRGRPRNPILPRLNPALIPRFTARGSRQTCS